MADESDWFKSSHSNQDNGGTCVSVSVLADHVGIRDTKQQNGPAVVTPAAAWTAFIRGVQGGQWAT
ncbi:DUF397 domain-containing protein [Streptomyces sp. NPDC008001]|uniref:DUF397 domain-containing protein n=1 Tax=Streptomyces sp. NPDC008001 TaxID=3364804 RepID=UPI0036EFC0AE